MNTKDIQSRLDRLEGVQSALLSRKASLETEIDKLKNDVDLLSKVSTVLKHLLDIMVKDEMTKMAGLVTYGLHSIFEDQDLSFIPEIGKRGEKLHVELITKKGPIKCGFGSMGGSVAVIESFLLRVICMLRMKSARFMLLDETFAPVGEKYIPATSHLLNELSKKLGLDVLLVTHQKDFQTEANAIYTAKETPNGLILEKSK